MYQISNIIWLFPILFIFHDFEEIIMMQSWIRKNRDKMNRRFPKLSKKLLPHFETITVSSFALGVAEEFILISIVTLISFFTGQYKVWAGLFIVYTLHLLMHCVQAVFMKGYIPALVTSLICLPVCASVASVIWKTFSFSDIILYSLFSFVFVLINLVGVHKGMDFFSKWIISYEQKTKQ